MTTAPDGTVTTSTQTPDPRWADPLLKTVSFGYDAADRITSQTLPDERVIGFGYDANGNVTDCHAQGEALDTRVGL